MKVIIVGCGATKLPYAAPAGQLYIGRHFRACYATAQAIAQPGDLVLILSALHGLLRPEGAEVNPYDMTFGEPGTVSPACIRDQAQIFGAEPGCRVIALCGARYADALRVAFGHRVETPLAGQGIGNQRRTLRLMREQPELDPSPEHAAAIAGTCSHGGHGWDGDTCADIGRPVPEPVRIPRTPPRPPQRPQPAGPPGRAWSSMAPGEFGLPERWVQPPLMLVPEEGMLV